MVETATYKAHGIIARQILILMDLNYDVYILGHDHTKNEYHKINDKMLFQVGSVIDFGVEIPNMTAFLFLGIACTVLTALRVISIYNRMFREALSENITENEPY